jgi:hypothetical protein
MNTRNVGDGDDDDDGDEVENHARSLLAAAEFQ